MSPEWPDLEQFEQLVIAQLDALPDAMVEKLDNVVFLAQDRPDDDEQILGVYEGVSLTERGDYGCGELPDRIVLFREPLIEKVSSLDELAHEIHVTLVHEIAHYFGLNDQQLHDLGWA